MVGVGVDRKEWGRGVGKNLKTGGRPHRNIRALEGLKIVYGNPKHSQSQGSV